MSLLAASRSPSQSTSSLASSFLAPTSVRFFQSPARRQKKGPPEPEKKYRLGSGRHGDGHPGRPRVLKLMPPNELKLKIFQPERRGERLELPIFSAEKVEAGQVEATEFPLAAGEPGFVYGLPKQIRREFRVLSKPYTLIREITKKTCGILDEAADKPSDQTRVVITGKTGTGKSYLLLQAVQYAKEKGWIVIYVPKAKKLVNSTSSYAYDIRTKTYVQPGASFGVLKRMLQANFEQLSNITLTTPYIHEKRNFPVDTPLSTLIAAVLKENSHPICPPLLERVMEELQKQEQFPVLVAVDELQALYGRSEYKDMYYGSIRPYHLSVPRVLLELACGKRKFAKGALLSALSSHTQYPVPLELIDQLKITNTRLISPAEKRNETVKLYAEGLTALEMPDRLNAEEAAEICDIWIKERAIKVANKDEFFLARYNESQGNPKDFVWKGLLNSLDY